MPTSETSTNACVALCTIGFAGFTCVASEVTTYVELPSRVDTSFKTRKPPQLLAVLVVLCCVNPNYVRGQHCQHNKHVPSQRGAACYFWRCLCFGLEQITITFPFLRIKEQLSQIFRTDGRTFIFFSQFLMIF